MAYVNVASWTCDQVAEWIKGLSISDVMCGYAAQLMTAGVSGAQLLQLSSWQLRRLGVSCVGHQETILAAVGRLQQLHFMLNSENLQNLAMRLMCKCNYLHRHLATTSNNNNNNNSANSSEGGRQDQRITVDILQQVNDLMTSVKEVISWLNTAPFVEQDSFIEMRARLLEPSIQLVVNAQRDSFAVRPLDGIRVACSQLTDVCRSIVQDSTDSLILLPAALLILTLKRTADEPLGLYLARAISGVTVIAGVKFASVAHKCAKLEQGDEIIQINYQAVVGWQLEKVIALLQDMEAGCDIYLTVKKRPKHCNVLDQVYFHPFRLPNKRRSAVGGAAGDVSGGYKWSSTAATLKALPMFSLPVRSVRIPDSMASARGATISSSSGDPASTPSAPTIDAGRRALSSSSTDEDVFLTANQSTIDDDSSANQTTAVEAVLSDVASSTSRGAPAASCSFSGGDAQVTSPGSTTTATAAAVCVEADACAARVTRRRRVQASLRRRATVTGVPASQSGAVPDTRQLTPSLMGGGGGWRVEGSHFSLSPPHSPTPLLHLHHTTSASAGVTAPVSVSHEHHRRLEKCRSVPVYGLRSDQQPDTLTYTTTTSRPPDNTGRTDDDDVTSDTGRDCGDFTRDHRTRTFAPVRSLTVPCLPFSAPSSPLACRGSSLLSSSSFSVTRSSAIRSCAVPNCPSSPEPLSPADVFESPVVSNTRSSLSSSIIVSVPSSSHCSTEAAERPPSTIDAPVSEENCRESADFSPSLEHTPSSEATSLYRPTAPTTAECPVDSDCWTRDHCPPADEQVVLVAHPSSDTMPSPFKLASLRCGGSVSASPLREMIDAMDVAFRGLKTSLGELSRTSVPGTSQSQFAADHWTAKCPDDPELSHVPAASQNDGVQCSGWLLVFYERTCTAHHNHDSNHNHNHNQRRQRRSGGKRRRHAWQRRWCILTCSGRLRLYCNSKQSERYEVEVVLAGCQVSPAPDVTSKKHVFRVLSCDCSVLLACRSRTLMAQWMNKLGLEAILFTAAHVKYNSHDACDQDAALVASASADGLYCDRTDPDASNRHNVERTGLVGDNDDVSLNYAQDTTLHLSSTSIVSLESFCDSHNSNIINNNDNNINNNSNNNNVMTDCGVKVNSSDGVSGVVSDNVSDGVSGGVSDGACQRPVPTPRRRSVESVSQVEYVNWRSGGGGGGDGGMVAPVPRPRRCRPQQAAASVARPRSLKKPSQYVSAQPLRDFQSRKWSAPMRLAFEMHLDGHATPDSGRCSADGTVTDETGRTSASEITPDLAAGDDNTDQPRTPLQPAMGVSVLNSQRRSSPRVTSPQRGPHTFVFPPAVEQALTPPPSVNNLPYPAVFTPDTYSLCCGIDQRRQ